MVEKIVQARGITKTFGKRQVLSGVDLEVERGSVVAVLGPNGAGKTTTVRILTTLLKPDSGAVSVAGHDVLREPDRVRSRIGVVGQSVTMDNELSGLQNLAMISRLYHFGRRDSRRRARELIDRFGLADAADRPVKAYSGGMRRRLDLAAGLIAAPAVLFLDEPTTGLDPESRTTAWEAIRALVRDGTTLLLTTQYLEEADQLADAVVVIDHGRIITRDTPANLKRRLGGQRLDISLADATGIALIPALRARALPAEIKPGMLSFAIPDGQAGLQEINLIVEELLRSGVPVTEQRLQQPTLEEAFLQIVGATADRPLAEVRS
jgi:daunorubicin resistance ABC transporter ATP-binding subunit